MYAATPPATTSSAPIARAWNVVDEPPVPAERIAARAPVSDAPQAVQKRASAARAPPHCVQNPALVIAGLTGSMPRGA
jgi:hypothetical protein